MTHEEKQIHNAVHAELREFEEFKELVRKMREARHRYSSLSREFCSKGMKPRQSQEWQDARKLTKQLESEVDEYLKNVEICD